MLCTEVASLICVAYIVTIKIGLKGGMDLPSLQETYSFDIRLSLAADADLCDCQLNSKVHRQHHN